METTKICFKCNKEKPISEYYKQKGMSDGHINKCKDCAKKDIHKNYEDNIKNPEWIKKEKKRAREKYHRLYSDVRPDPEYKKTIMKKYKELYPEKQLAKNFIGKKFPKLEGRLQRHHWSYNKEHWIDFIILVEIEHRKLHRYMVYDQERMMYRTTDGILLDTKEKALQYYDSLKNLD